MRQNAFQEELLYFLVVVGTKEDLTLSGWEGNGGSCTVRAWPKT